MRNLFLFGMLLSSVAIAEEPTRLVAFGDSTTATRGPLNVYAAVLQKELPARQFPVTVINAGVGGHNTDHARTRFEKDVLARNPDIVVIQFGINDAAIDVWKDPPATESRVSLDRYVQNLTDFVQTLKAAQVRVILMTPNPLQWTPGMRKLYGKPPYQPDQSTGFNVRLVHYSQKVRELAKTENVPLVDVERLFEEYGMQDGKSVDDLLLDGVHPNDSGHRLVADHLMTELLKLPSAH
ncbi:MAG: GDSL-type esterase/lipase family protein [Planctomycetaceae bacterium]